MSSFTLTSSESSWKDFTGGFVRSGCCEGVSGGTSLDVGEGDTTGFAFGTLPFAWFAELVLPEERLGASLKKMAGITVNFIY